MPAKSSKRPGGADTGEYAAERRELFEDRRITGERRKRDEGPPEGVEERRRAERRTGLDRRRAHLHYEELTPHPRPDRNINDYPLSTDEVEFINAINDYKSKFDRPFPTWSEILHILRTMGYVRVDGPPLNLPIDPSLPFGLTPPPGDRESE